MAVKANRHLRLWALDLEATDHFSWSHMAWSPGFRNLSVDMTIDVA